MESARSMLHAYNNLPRHLWAEAVHIAVYVLHRTINKQLDRITPFEMWYKCKPTVSHYRMFGSLAFVHLNKKVRRKLDPKSFAAIFVGHSYQSKVYRFWNPQINLIIESADDKFDERPGRSNFTSFPTYDRLLSADVLYPGVPSSSLSPIISLPELDIPSGSLRTMRPL